MSWWAVGLIFSGGFSAGLTAGLLWMALVRLQDKRDGYD